MLHLAAYLKEREGFDSIVAEEGFASYKIMGEECYIRDIWVHSDCRKAGLASSLADTISRIAIDSGCKFLSGSVSTAVGDPTVSTKVLLAYGFQVHSAVTNAIFFRKDL